MRIKIKAKIEMSAAEHERLMCLAQRGHGNGPDGHFKVLKARSTEEIAEDAAFLDEVADVHRKIRAAFEAAS